MKRWFILAVLPLVLAGCGAEKEVKNVPVWVRDSLETRSELGELLKREFVGTIPCADCPGIRCELTLYNQEHSGDGVYQLKRTYLEAENGEDVSFDISGRWITLRGDAVNPDATVIQLSPQDDANRENLLYMTDSLILLNAAFELPDSAMIRPFTIHKVAAK